MTRVRINRLIFHFSVKHQIKMAISKGYNYSITKFALFQCYDSYEQSSNGKYLLANCIIHRLDATDEANENAKIIKIKENKVTRGV